ncbi:MAG TPA: hypothetical protein VMS96_11905 [Terriglobales bacterium]|nr:hypothetical protein [Terriglobales bacterium]
MRAAIHLLIVLFICIPSIAQTTDSTASSSASAQLATTVLTQMLTAGGWAPATLPNDAIATATASMGNGVITKTITFKARGRTQFRWEYSDAPGQATKSDLSAGLARAANGMGITPQSAPPWLLPFLGRLQEFADPQVRVEYLGTEVVGEPTYKLRLRRVPDATDPRADEVKAGSPMTVWLSTTTYLPVQIEYLLQTFTNRLAFIPRLRKYSDYRPVQGILVPFHQEIWVDEQLVSTLDITSVQFNVGLAARDFQLTTASQGGH